jgi:hypothetical protein
MRPSEGEAQVVAEKRRVFGIAKHSEEKARAEITGIPFWHLLYQVTSTDS